MARHSSTSAEELIQVCAESNDPEAWEEFVCRFDRAISLSVIRTVHQWGENRRQVVEDLVQETYTKLCADNCRALLEFSRRHPDAVLGYIKTIAINATHDHFKSLRSQKRGAGRAEDPLEELDPKAGDATFGSPSSMERQVLLAQIDRCLEACTAGPDQQRDCLIFRLYYQQGLTAKAIAALPEIGLTAKGVESAIQRLIRLVREQLVQLRSSSAGPDPEEKGYRPAESY